MSSPNGPALHRRSLTVGFPSSSVSSNGPGCDAIAVAPPVLQNNLLNGRSHGQLLEYEASKMKFSEAVAELRAKQWLDRTRKQRLAHVLPFMRPGSLGTIGP
jgi:hypothetical protein